MRQRSVTLCIPVLDQARAGLALAEIARDTVRIDGALQPSVFQGLGIHFARIVLIEEPSSSPFRSALVIESNFDTAEPDARRAAEAHLTELLREKRAALAPLFACCEGLSERQSDGELASALMGRIGPSTAEYQGHSGRDLGRIRLEARVRELCVAALPAALGEPQDPRRRYDRLRAEVKKASLAEGLDVDFDGPAPPEPDADARAKKLTEHWQPWLKCAGHALPLLPLVPLVLVRELLDRPYDLQREAELRGPAAEARAMANAASEDHFAQNALVHLVALKPGLFRRFLLETAHRYIAALAVSHFDFVEQLGGIPSIHFAKWLLIDGGRRLLFFSNYDGNWESYLGDFVDQAAVGLNLAWFSTEGYPRTRLVAFGGASDEERFKAWARAHQRPAQVFYSAYPNLSVSRINNSTWVRHGLHAPGPKDVEAYLRRLT